jgi:2-haloacid dehalogenase
MTLSEIQALTFDVFGTVVDWRSTIIREGKRLGRRHNLQVDWAAFADSWRAGYAPAMQQVRSGHLPWLKLDDLHRMILDDLLVRFAITGLQAEEIEHLNRVWHRLAPWSDVKQGLRRLRRRYVLATLSNGNMALLTHMAKHGNLQWDCILSAELARHYKPDPAVYRMAAEVLSLAPHEILMVAAHPSDLDAAQAVGLRTAYVHRPYEFGPHRATDLPADLRYDVVATDFIDLAGQLAG